MLFKRSVRVFTGLDRRCFSQKRGLPMKSYYVSCAVCALATVYLVVVVAFKVFAYALP